MSQEPPLYFKDQCDLPEGHDYQVFDIHKCTYAGWVYCWSSPCERVNEPGGWYRDRPMTRDEKTRQAALT